MKTLFRIMLAFLLALSVATALVVVFHINRSGGDEDAQISNYSSDGDAAEEPDIDVFNDTVEDERQWQRAIVKPDGSEYWHYYPVIPDDAKPGSTIVLSATSKGFVDWEVDSDYANVELTNQSADTDLVHVSFIMPEEEVVIRALYEEMPIYNDSLSLSRYDLHEYGEVPIMPFNILTLPDGMVGATYGWTLAEGGVPAGTTWEIDSDLPLPTGFSFNPTIARVSSANPPASGTFSFAAIITTTTDAGENKEVREYSITIWDTPEIKTENLPDGMVDVPYSADINASGDALSASAWTWSATGSFPGGLSFSSVVSDITNAGVRGTPSSPGTTYNFSVTLTPANAQFATITKVFIIGRIWTPPEITTSPILPDGMVEYRYSENLAATGGALAVSTWTWSAVNLPSGLDITTDSPGIGRISGEPAAPGKALVFTVRLTADENTLIGFTEKVFTIENIWARPVITTKPTDFPDGMVGPPNTTIEPGEEPYYIEIEAEGFPSNTTTTWDWGYSGDIPDGLDFKPVGINGKTLSAIITGIPKEHGKFEFTVEMTAVDTTNDNIKGAVISSEPFTIIIWPRTYLHIDIAGTDGYVSRPGDKWDETDVNESNRYKDKRAVMPGTKGIITTIANNGFIRWEVLLGYDTSDQVEIGGPDNYGHREGGRIGFVTIEIPKNPAGPVTPAWDVYIRGVHARTPVITASLSRGTIGDLSYAGPLSIAEQDIGTGPGSLRWDVVKGVLPTGLELDETAGRTTSIDVIEGKQIGGPDGVFDFTVGVTLPGTMRIDRPFSITILPIPGILLGDVNNDGFVNLADLVTLAVYLEDGSVEINEAAADINRNNRVDTGDLTLLARYFARFGILGQ